jgi:hypothetical protein
VSSENQPKSTGDGDQCGNCQHNVVVRGVEQIVCLAYLTVRHPMHDGECGEFVNKRKRMAAQRPTHACASSDHPVDP